MLSHSTLGIAIVSTAIVSTAIVSTAIVSTAIVSTVIVSTAMVSIAIVSIAHAAEAHPAGGGARAARVGRPDPSDTAGVLLAPAAGPSPHSNPQP